MFLCVCLGGGVGLWSPGSWWDQEFLFSWMAPNVAYTTHLSTRRGRGKGTWLIYPQERGAHETTTAIWKSYFCRQRWSGSHKGKQIFSFIFQSFPRLKIKCSSIWMFRVFVPNHRQTSYLSFLPPFLYPVIFFFMLQIEIFPRIVFIRLISFQKLPVPHRPGQNSMTVSQDPFLLHKVTMIIYINLYL